MSNTITHVPTHRGWQRQTECNGNILLFITQSFFFFRINITEVAGSFPSHKKMMCVPVPERRVPCPRRRHVYARITCRRCFRSATVAERLFFFFFAATAMNFNAAKLTTATDINDYRCARLRDRWLKTKLAHDFYAKHRNNVVRAIMK